MKRWRWRQLALFIIFSGSLIAAAAKVKSYLQIMEPVRTLAFSADGSLLAIGSYEGVQIQDVSTARTLRVGSHPFTAAVCFSPRGNLLASASPRTRPDSKVYVWNIATGEKLYTLTSIGGIGAPIAFSPDGNLLAVCCPRPLPPDPGGAAPSEAYYYRYDDIKVWDMRNGRLNYVLKGQWGNSGGGTQQIYFTGDGRNLICAGSDSVKILSLKTSKVLCQLTDVRAVLGCIPQYHKLLVVLRNKNSKTTERVAKWWQWDKNKIQNAFYLPTPYPFYAALRRDGKLLATASMKSNIAKVSSPGQRQPKYTVFAKHTSVSFLTFSPDSKILCIGDTEGSIKLCRVL